MNYEDKSWKNLKEVRLRAKTYNYLKENNDQDEKLKDTN